MSLARLQQLREVVAECDGGLAAWLEAGIAHWEAGEPLDRALELCGPRAIVNRDAAVRRIARNLDPDGKRAKWPLAADVAAVLIRFESGRWRHLQGERDPDLSPLNRAAFDALTAAQASGQSMPTSQRTIYRLIR